MQNPYLGIAHVPEKAVLSYFLYLKNEENYYSISAVLHCAFMGTGGF